MCEKLLKKSSRKTDIEDIQIGERRGDKTKEYNLMISKKDKRTFHFHFFFSDFHFFF